MQEILNNIDHNNTNHDNTSSLYQVDSETSLVIVSSRVYNLRKLQSSEGLDLSALRLEQRGLAPVSYMHHVSKIVEGKAESFRVRVCRTCSGLPALLELGSYSDVESALLVNDAHEIMNGRFKQLHILCRDDINYLKLLYVRKRGCNNDSSLLNVINERLYNIKPKKRNRKDKVTSLTRSMKSSNESTNQVNTTSNVLNNNIPINLSDEITTNDMFHNYLQLANENDDETLKSVDQLSEVSINYDDELDINNTTLFDIKSNKNKSSNKSNNKSSNGLTTALNTLTTTLSSNHPSSNNLTTNLTNNLTNNPSSNLTNSLTSNLPNIYPIAINESNTIPLTSHMISNHLPLPVHINNKQTNRSNYLIEQFKVNVSSIRSEYLFWGYFNNDNEITNFIDCLLSTVNIYLDNNSIVNKTLYQLLQDSALPRSYIFCVMASLFPGEVTEISDICRKLQEELPQDNYPISKFVAQYLLAQQSLDVIIRNKDSHSKPNSEVNENEWYANISSIVKFLRLCHSSTAYYDYTSRMCPWESEVQDIQEAEIRIQGIYQQLYNRILYLLKLLFHLKHSFFDNISNDLSFQLSSNTSNQLINESKSKQSTDDNMNSYMVLVHHLYKNILLATIQSLLSLTTLAILNYKICYHKTCLYQCITICNDVLPVLVDLYNDKAILQLFLQRHLDCISTYMRSIDDNDNDVDLQSNSDAESKSPLDSFIHSNENIKYSYLSAISKSSSLSNEFRLLAYTIGEELIKQIKKYFWVLPDNLNTTNAVIFYESSFRSYNSIFQLALQLNESDFLSNNALDIMKLLNAINASIMGFSQWIQTLNSSIINLHTIISLHALIETCLVATAKFPSARGVMYQLVRNSRLVLWSTSSKFILSKVLLDQLTIFEEKFLAKQLNITNKRQKLNDDK